MQRFSILALTAVLAAAALASARDVIVIAHRGASGFLPEPTLEAYTMAYAHGSETVEPDLVLTQGGVFTDFDEDAARVLTEMGWL